MKDKCIVQKIVSILLVITLITAVIPLNVLTVGAAQVDTQGVSMTSGSFEYIVLSDGTAEITDYTGSDTELTIPSTLDGYKVTSIGDRAFCLCTSLTSITIPSSVTSIGESAFFDCSNLKSITVDSNNKYYDSRDNCNAIIETSTNTLLFGCNKTIIPDSVTHIGDSAFYGCNRLTSITIPSSVTSIGNGAFYYCSNLKSITVDSNNKYYDSRENCNAIIETATNSLILGCKNTIIPESVTSIGKGAFYCCSNLTNVTIPEGVTSIGESAFYGCSNLTSVTIPESVTIIGDSAFDGCYSLTSVTIPEGVTSIGEYAFCGCSNLTSVTIPEGVTSIGGFAFIFCTSLASVTIPESVTIIGEYAFTNCTSLESITIPEGVTSIGDSAFLVCSELKDVWYTGSYSDKNNIDIASGNSCLTGATWHYNTCISEHTYSSLCDSDCNNCDWVRNVDTEHSYSYICDADCNGCGVVRKVTHTWKSEYSFDDETHFIECSVCKEKKDIPIEHSYYNVCDTTCNTCGYIRTVPDHSYILNGNHTCSNCRYSKRPAKPTVQSKTDNNVTLVEVEGFEYSKDGENWQTSNVFSGLLYNTSYTFYQRVKSSSAALVSETSEGTVVTIKSSQSAPSAPIILSFTDTVVTLAFMPNCEYSADGINWQLTNVFSGLSPNTKYTFYQRYPETATHEASANSYGTIITTDKSKQTLIPNAPTVKSCTSYSITLEAVDGCEYSMDGKYWQSSPEFSGLDCVTEYTFYQRYKETSTTYEGKRSEATKAKTDKGTQYSPLPPILSSKSHDMVTLRAENGYEYSRDGVNWQNSSTFIGLSPETNYMFYQRKAETDKYYASDASSYLIVKTDETGSLKSVSVTQTPTEIIYSEMDGTLTLTGGKITLVYDNGATGTIDITSEMLTEYDVTSGENQNITLTYGGLSVSFVAKITTIPKNEKMLLGDIDGDGKVTIIDATYIQRHIAQLTTIPENRIACADTDKDGKVSIIDATMIQRFIAQLIPEL